MVTVKRIVCLANSRKMNERCVAGKEWTAHAPALWIRPVGSRPMGEILLRERRYENGADPELLDIIDVPLQGPQPKSFQSENWLLYSSRRWVLAGHAKWAELSKLIDEPAALWLNDFHTRAGVNDRVAESAARRLSVSLYLLHLDALKLSVSPFGEDIVLMRRRVQAHFVYRGTEYKLWVTDPLIERTYRAKPDGDYNIGECFVTVSLGEPHKGDCYKLVAAVIAPDRERK